MEFALILPFMALLYFGAIELSLLISADRKVTETASALADLVARTDTINAADVSNVFDASRALFEPYDASTVEMRITSLIDKDGVAKVDWSQGRNIAARNAGDTVTVQAGVLPASGSVIMAEVSYNYKTALGFFLKDGMVLHETFFLRPRMSDSVIWSTN
ncbi:MAG: TadE/TadG family type IV pilus assembly protein [Alphaproteobacteria bacterium]